MKTLLIHGGFGKTGTTSIQTYLYNNRHILLSAYNILYPEISKDSYNHFRFISRANTIDTLKWCVLKDILISNPADTVILSDENISDKKNWSFTKENYALIKEYFPDYTVKIIMYLRREDDRIKSQYGQILKKTRNFEYLPHYNRWLTESSVGQKCFFDLPQNIRSVRELLGKENVILRLFDKNLMREGNAISDFMDVLGLPFPLGHPDEILTARENPSFPISALPYLVHLCRRTPGSNPETQKKLRSLVAECFDSDAEGKTNFFSAQAVQEVLEEMEHLCPGYKNIYKNRPISWNLNDATADPALVLIAALGYHICQIEMTEAESRRKMQKKIVNQVSALKGQIDLLQKQLANDEADRARGRIRFSLMRFLRFYSRSEGRQ